MDGRGVLVEGLARCSWVAPEAVLAQLDERDQPVAWLAHPQAVRTLETVSGLGAELLERVLTLAESPAVRQELLAYSPESVVRTLAHPAHRSLTMPQAAAAALAGDETCAWDVLAFGPSQSRAQLLGQLAAGSRPAARSLVWLANLLKAGLLDEGPWRGLPDPLAAYVDTLRRVAKAGEDPVERFVVDTVDSLRHKRALVWALADGPLVGQKAWWAQHVVWQTGLPQMAERVLDYWSQPRVWQAVVTHPHLAGAPVVERAREEAAQAVVASGAPPARVQDTIAVMATNDAWDCDAWVNAGHDDPEQVAVAWWWWSRSRTSGALSWVTLRSALHLACAAPAGAAGIWPQVKEMVALARARDVEQFAVVPHFDALVAVATGVHEHGGVGAVPVPHLARAWAVGMPSWIGPLVGDVLERTPGLRTAAAQRVLLTLGAHFEGTLDDLVAATLALSS